MGRAELPPQSDMPKIMRTWRARRNLDDVPGMSALPRHRHRRGGLTQSIMADLLGVDERHYRRLEHGEGRISKDLVRECARILGLNPAEASALYVWSGHQPPRAVVPQHPDVPDDLLGMLHRIGHGAYWSDDTYTVLAYNRRAAWHWPWMQRPGANIMEELLAPSSQGREQCRMGGRPTGRRTWSPSCAAAPSWTGTTTASSGWYAAYAGRPRYAACGTGTSARR